MRCFFLKAIKFLIGLLLLPILSPIMMEIWRQARNLNEYALWLENPLSLCLGGLVLWIVFALLFHLPPQIYVFAHEFTHALFVKLCGGRVKKISVKRDSGYIVSDRNNFLIVLAPYLFPFYATLLGLFAMILGLWIPTHHFQIPLWIGIGVCLGYHWTMTGRMLTTHQSDFSSQGYFFSFVLILTINFLLLLLIFLVLPTPHGFLGRARIFAVSAVHSYHNTFKLLEHGMHVILKKGLS